MHEQIILFENDASRFITGFGVFSIVYLENSNPYPEENMFQQLLKPHTLLYIKARVKHPQSNGKAEQVKQVIEQQKMLFPSWDDAVVSLHFSTVSSQP